LMLDQIATLPSDIQETRNRSLDATGFGMICSLLLSRLHRLSHAPDASTSRGRLFSSVGTIIQGVNDSVKAIVCQTLLRLVRNFRRTCQPHQPR
jgi:hypothetical protein